MIFLEIQSEILYTRRLFLDKLGDIWAPGDYKFSENVPADF